MFKNSGKIVLSIAVAVFLITSCAAPQVTLPTPDLNLVRTEAVVTALAQQTKEAALKPNPSQAPVAATSEPMATSTPYVITATSSIYSGGGVSSGGTGGGGSSGGTAIPTWTPVIYAAQFVTQNYLDGYPCQTGGQLDFKITLKNIGAATWSHLTYYYKRLYNSPDVKLTNSDQYPLPVDVLSGSKVDLIIDIACPTYPSPTAWTTQWGLVNDNGAIFAKFYFRFFTVEHVTPTPTKTHTPSPG